MLLQNKLNLEINDHFVIESYIRSNILCEISKNQIKFALLLEKLRDNLKHSNNQKICPSEQLLMELGEKIAMLMHINNQFFLSSSSSGQEEFFLSLEYDYERKENDLFLLLIESLHMNAEFLNGNHIKIAFKQQNILNYFIAKGILRNILEKDSNLMSLACRNFVEDTELIRICLQLIKMEFEKVVSILKHLALISSDNKNEEGLVNISSNSISLLIALNVNFPGFIFKGIKWNNVNLHDGIFTGAQFIQCDLKYCNFTNCKLNNVTFEKCNLENVKFKDITVSDSIKQIITSLAVAKKYEDLHSYFIALGSTDGSIKFAIFF